MNNKLDCEIIKDLLPSYVDGLTSEKTNEAVKEHVASCEGCAQALEIMREPETEKAETPQLDYLKKVRHRSRKASVIAGIAMFLLGALLLGYRFLYVGSKASPAAANCTAEVSGDTLTLSGNMDGGSGVTRVSFSFSAGMVEATLYTAPKSFLSHDEFSFSYTAADTINQVRVGNLIIWENGETISEKAALLNAARHDFVGDMPENAELVRIIGVGEQFGDSTNELQTDSYPYGWTLILESAIDPSDEAAAKKVMEGDSLLMLATIGNLGYVTWQYQTGDGQTEYTITTKEASELLGQDIKQNRGAALIQSILNMYRW